MEKYLRNLRIIYWGTLVFPILLIVIYSIAIEKGTIMLNNDLDNIFRYLIPIFAFVFIVLGFVIFKTQLNKIEVSESSNSKLLTYRQIFIQRIAFIEGISIFSAVACLATLNSLYIIYTLLTLLCYLFVFPTITKINQDLGITTEDKVDEQIEKKSGNLFRKNSWVITLLLGIMVYYNYDSFSKYFTNKIVLPTIKIDNGILKDTTYRNEYLDWTMKIPSGYSVISNSEIEGYVKKGEQLLGTKSEGNKPVRLLNVTNGGVGFQSNLNPRVLYPKMTSEEVYLEYIDKQLLGANLDSIKIKKTSQGNILIGNSQFKFAEYITTQKSEKKIIYFTKFNRDYIFDISIIYSDSIEGAKIIDRLKKSKLNWE